MRCGLIFQSNRAGNPSGNRASLSGVIRISRFYFHVSPAFLVCALWRFELLLYRIQTALLKGAFFNESVARISAQREHDIRAGSLMIFFDVIRAEGEQR